MIGLTTVQQFAVLIAPVLLAITLHEVAHGWVARALGDDTAARLGRLSLNPLRHVDPVGTVVIPLVSYFLSGMLFGWAKPVPINWNRLGHPRRDVALVAAAGPAANLLMALLWSLVTLGALQLEILPWMAIPLVYTGATGILVNAVLIAINLVPILPLDGGRILHALLPPRLAAVFARMEPFGLPILILLLLTGWLSHYLSTVVIWIIEPLPASQAVFQLLFTG
ncbi:MAG: site-2 protease family protein [Pseudomonadota bacterium]